MLSKGESLMDASDIDWLREEMRRWSETFRASVPIDRWLEHEFWDETWPHDVRREWDREERWFWIIPDFEKGRSRIVGVEGHLLREDSPQLIQNALERANWKARLEEEHLLVVRGAGGTIGVVTWEPEIDEVWFEDPRGGFYNAYKQTSRSMWSSGPPFLG